MSGMKRADENPHTRQCSVRRHRRGQRRRREAVAPALPTGVRPRQSAHTQECVDKWFKCRTITSHSRFSSSVDLSGTATVRRRTTGREGRMHETPIVSLVCASTDRRCTGVWPRRGLGSRWLRLRARAGASRGMADEDHRGQLRSSEQSPRARPGRSWNECGGDRGVAVAGTRRRGRACRRRRRCRRLVAVAKSRAPACAGPDERSLGDSATECLKFRFRSTCLFHVGFIVGIEALCRTIGWVIAGAFDH